MTWSGVEHVDKQNEWQGGTERGVSWRSMRSDCYLDYTILIPHQFISPNYFPSHCMMVTLASFTYVGKRISPPHELNCRNNFSVTWEASKPYPKSLIDGQQPDEAAFVFETGQPRRRQGHADATVCRTAGAAGRPRAPSRVEPPQTEVVWYVEESAEHEARAGAREQYVGWVDRGQPNSIGDGTACG